MRRDGPLHRHDHLRPLHNASTVIVRVGNPDGFYLDPTSERKKTDTDTDFEKNQIRIRTGSVSYLMILKLDEKTGSDHNSKTGFGFAPLIEQLSNLKTMTSVVIILIYLNLIYNLSTEYINPKSIGTVLLK